MKTITIKINEKDYPNLEKYEYTFECCDSWDEVTLEDEINYQNWLNKKSDELKEKYTDKSIIQLLETTNKLIGRLVYYAKIDENVARMMDSTDLQNLINDKLNFLSKARTTKKIGEIKTIKINDQEYKLHDELTTINTEDFVVIMTADENNKHNPAISMSIMMSILYKKEGENSLKDYNLDERINLMKKQPITLASSVYSFFLSRYQILKEFSQIYSKENVNKLVLKRFKELIDSIKQLEQESGISFSSRIYLTLIRMYVKSLKGNWDKHYNSSQSKNMKTNLMKILEKFVQTKNKIKTK